jgi:hypothetical protein
MNFLRKNYLVILIVLLFLLIWTFYQTRVLHSINRDLSNRIDSLILTMPVHCDDSKRFTSSGGSTATEIPAAQAKSWTDEYRRAHEIDISIFHITGFRISKKALNKIFDDPLVNCITMDLYDNEGVNLGMVMKGIVSDKSDITLDPAVNSSVFNLTSYCPSDCGQY